MWLQAWEEIVARVCIRAKQLVHRYFLQLSSLFLHVVHAFEKKFETDFLKTTRLDKTKLDTQDDFIKILLKSAFAKQLFGDNTAAKVLSTFDPMLQTINELEAFLISN